MATSRDQGSKLRIRNLRKTYHSVVALAGANLDVREGEFVTLLGPSGSGKTTMMMIVAGLIQPDAGEVWIDARLATYTASFKRDIGVVFQNYALFPHLTVFDNIAFPLRMRKQPEATIAKEVGRVLELVCLPGVADRFPSALSGGQQQRIALARCIVYRPSIIVMDEPLGALDKKLRDQMQLEIKQLHHYLGTTVLYVTHDQEEAMTMSDRICVMNEGRIEQVGAPRDLYFRPESLFVADFLGESNILEASVLGTGESVTLRTEAGTPVRAPACPELNGAARVKFMVRPECLAVLGPDERAANVVEGVLRDVVLAGGVTKYYVTLPDGQVVRATQLTSGLTRTAAAGASVRLGWAVESTVLLPERPRSQP